MSRTENLDEDSYLVTHTVDSGRAGMRLDAFLKACYSRRSRQQIQKAIDDGIISLKRNQGPHLTAGRLKASSQMVDGDEVTVLSERKPEPEVCFDYKVLHEDETILVIEKPANLPVHPAGRYFFNTLLVHLRTKGHQTPLRAGREFFLVHRIDKETSGVLVLSKSRETCSDLTKQFAERKTEKTYLAVVKGVVPAEFSVDLPLKRATGSAIRLKMMAVKPEHGEKELAESYPSLTEFRRLSVHENQHGAFSLIECFPKTGRQHQIRVHLDAIGHPIVGDKLYGRPEFEALRFYERYRISPEAEAALIIPRHALHAHRLRFTHPITGARMDFTSELPEDLKRFLGA